MRVLVTGAGGFVGSHLVESQLAQGNKVRAVDVHAGNLSGIAGHAHLDVLLADITDETSHMELMADVDIVYNLASAHLDISQPDAHYYAVNVTATQKLLAAARTAGAIRFVHCSSNGVLGDIHQLPADETAPCHPTNIYEQTKLLGEQAVLAFWQETAFPVVIARPAWVYGPRCPRTSKLLRTIARGRFVMFGDGTTLRHPIYVADAVRGLERCASHGKPGEIYFLAGDQAVSIETLVRAMAKELDVSIQVLHLPVSLGIAAGYVVQAAFKPLGRRPPFSRRTIDFFLKDNAYVTNKAQNELNFYPQTSLVDGIGNTIGWSESSRDGVGIQDIKIE